MDLPGNYCCVSDLSHCPGPAPVTAWGHCRMGTIPRVPCCTWPVVPVCQPSWISQAHIALSMPFPAFWLLAQPCIRFSRIKDLVLKPCLLSMPSPDTIFWVLKEFYSNLKWPLHTDCWSSPLFVLILRQSSVNSQHPRPVQYYMDEWRSHSSVPQL